MQRKFTFITELPEGEKVVQMLVHKDVIYVATTHQVCILNRETNVLEPLQFKIKEED